MRQCRLWSLIFIFSRKNMLMVVTSLEDTPMSNICNRSSIEVKETILKDWRQYSSTLLTLSSADNKTSNNIFKIKVLRSKKNANYQNLFKKFHFSCPCQSGQPLWQQSIVSMTECVYEQQRRKLKQDSTKLLKVWGGSNQVALLQLWWQVSPSTIRDIITDCWTNNKIRMNKCKLILHK
jgi:hypothetical protein